MTASTDRDACIALFDPRRRREGAEAGKLVSLGYDFASRLVHPMATDGHEDFFNHQVATGPRFSGSTFSPAKTLLIATMAVQQGLTAIRFRWRRVVFDFLDKCDVAWVMAQRATASRS